MKRPYVICHMLTSINGKIDGTFMSASESTPALVEYSNLRNSFNCEATLYGTTTMLGGFSDGYAGELVHDNTECSYEDYIAPSDVKNYIISIDPKGILGYNSCYIEKKNRPKAYGY